MEPVTKQFKEWFLRMVMPLLTLATILPCNMVTAVYVQDLSGCSDVSNTTDKCQVAALCIWHRNASIAYKKMLICSLHGTFCYVLSLFSSQVSSFLLCMHCSPV